jgi:hypothetical protein
MKSRSYKTFETILANLSMKATNVREARQAVRQVASTLQQKELKNFVRLVASSESTTERELAFYLVTYFVELNPNTAGLLAFIVGGEVR